MKFICPPNIDTSCRTQLIGGYCGLLPWG